MTKPCSISPSLLRIAVGMLELAFGDGVAGVGLIVRVGEKERSLGRQPVAKDQFQIGEEDGSEGYFSNQQMTESILRLGDTVTLFVLNLDGYLRIVAAFLLCITIPRSESSSAGFCDMLDLL